MAGAAGVRAGRAFVEAYLNDSKLRAGLKGLENRFKAFGASLRSIGAKAAGIAGAAALPFALAAKSAAGFESTMAGVKAVLRETGNSAEDIGKLADEAKRLGRDTQFSAAQAAEAMMNFATAGLSANEILQATGPTLDLAATASIGIGDAAKIAAVAMKDMKLSASELTRVTDVLAKAYVSAGNTDIPLLGEAIAKVGPLAKTAGLSLEQLVGTIEVLSDQGISGAEAGTALRGMISSLTGPTEKAVAMMKELRVETIDKLTGNFRGIEPIIKDFEKALAGMGSGVRLQKLGDIFDSRQINSAALLIEAGSARIGKATAKLGDSTGTASRIAAAKLDTLQGSFDLVVSSAEGLRIEVGEALTPILRSFGQVAMGAMNGIALLAKANPELIVSFAKGVVAVGAFGAGLYAAGLAARSLALGVRLLGVAVTATAAVVKGTTALLGAFAVILHPAAAFTSIAGGLAAVLGAVVSPIGLVAAGLGALAYWFVRSGNAAKLLAGIGEGLRGLMADATAAFGGISDALKAGDIGLAGKILWATLRLEWAKGIGALDGMWQDWGGAFQQVFSDASFAIARKMAWLTGTIGDMWSALMGDLDPESTLGRAGEALQRGIGKGAEFLGGSRGKMEKGRPRGLSRTGEMLKSLDDQQEAADAARLAASRAAVDAAAKGLEDVKAELAGLLGQAKEGPGGGAWDWANSVLGTKGAKAAPSPEGIGAGMDRAAKNVEVAGTFNAATIGQLGAGSIGEKQLTVAKETKDEIVGLRRDVRGSGTVLT